MGQLALFDEPPAPLALGIGQQLVLMDIAEPYCAFKGCTTELGRWRKGTWIMGPYVMLKQQPVRIRANICQPHAQRSAGPIYYHRLDTYWAIRLLTDTHCERCGEPYKNAGGYKRPVVDHNHNCCGDKNNRGKSCGYCVRAILCDGCNNKQGVHDRRG